MAGGLDNLSAEGLSQLSGKLNEATRNLEKALKQQETLLKTTLEVEQKIISNRVASLEELNDGYSRLLNFVSSEISSLNAEMFKATEASREAVSNTEKAANSAKQAQTPRGSNQTAFGGDGSRSAGQTIDDDTLRKLEDADSANYESFSERFKARRAAIISEAELSEAINKREKERIAERAAAEKDAYNALLDLRLSALNQGTEAVEQRAAYSNALDDAKALQALQADWDKQRAELEYQAKLEGEGLITAEAMARIDAEMARRIGGEEDIQKRVAEYKKKQVKDEKKRREKEEKDKLDTITNLDAKGFGSYSVAERITDLNGMRDGLIERYVANGANEESAKMSANFKMLADTLSSLAQDLEKTMGEIAGMRGKIDTRLQGSNDTKTDYTGSYWNRITKDIISVGAINPFFKQEKFAKKIEELVDVGIAFDLEQRAFLGTISDKIATTFNVADSTLLRLIRIQQQDSTAGRLGMESALNTFLNNMYENTEYLKTVASSVRTSLEEMQALMEGVEATEVEYQVQKWMGSLYSVGMSQNAVTSITNALGQIAAGQIEGLTGDGAGNLLIMAANNAGVPIADILAKGIDADKTNELLQATVNYLAELAESSKDNRVVQQQLANVFGVKASDLLAATNLAIKGSVGAIYDESLSYDNMLRQLYKMAASMGLRTSAGEMMSNVWDNAQYTLAGSMASSPISYLVYKMAGLLESTTGGIDIGLPMVMGTGIPIQFKVSDLMRAGSLATGILGTLPQMINGLVTSTNGALMLASMGVDFGSGLNVTPRGDSGSGVGLLPANGDAKTTSSSGYVGNASTSDIKNSTIQQNEDNAKQQVIEAVEESEANQVDAINTTVLKIYELLDDVAHGNSCLKVKVESYGLTKAGNSGGSLGGVNALNNLSTDYDGGLSAGKGDGGNLASGGVNSGGIYSSINFGGWTTTV